jgi:hypothetical protein
MECGNIIYQRPAEIFNLGDERRGAAQWLKRGGGCAFAATRERSAAWCAAPSTTCF